MSLYQGFKCVLGGM